MSWYEKIWTAVTGCFCAVALLAAFDGWTPLELGGIFLAMGPMGVMMVVSRLPPSGPWTWPIAKGFVGSGVVTWLALGLGHLAGGTGLVVGALLAVAAPALLGRYSLVAARFGLRQPRPRRSGGQRLVGHRAALQAPAYATVDLSADEPVPVLEVPDLMSDLDLCQAWRSSYVALQRAMSVESRARVVEMRALYLDELERRAGSAVRAWLASGARAASDPSRYVSPARRQRRRRSVAE